MRALALALFLLPGVALGAVAVDQTDFTGGYGSGAKTVTVDTAGADRLLVLIHNNIYDECTGNSVTSSGLTWTRIVHQVVSSKCTDIWVAWAAAQLTAHDISVNVGTNAEYALDVISFSGARDMTSLVAGTDYRTCTASGSAAPASTPACTATTITDGAMLAGGVMQWAGTQIAVGAGTELVHAAVGDGVHYAVRSTATVAQGSQTLTMAGNAPDSWVMAWAEVSAPQASPSPSPSPHPGATWFWGSGSISAPTLGVAQQGVAAPVFAPVAGTYEYQPVSVSLSTETAGAAIYYTTNGDTPTAASTLYSAPFDVTETTTAKAIGIKNGLQNSSVVTATYTITDAPPPPEHSLGIGTSWPFDWVQDRPFADIARTIRDVKNSDGSALLTGGDIDTNGFPKTTGFRLGLWGGQYNMNGTYSVTFGGQCSSVTPNAGTMSALSYNAGTTTATYTLSDPYSTDVSWTFAGCTREDGSGLNGIASIKIMRPVTPGSVVSYATTDKYTNEFKQMLQKFGVVRFMDWTVTNWNPIQTWSQRPKPTWLSYGLENKQLSTRDLGASWEEVVQLANEIDRDIWINVPLHADDDYVVKLAQLLAYGSDGSTPYTEVQGSPTYPALEAGRKIYVEYSNEIWNTGFTQWADNVTLTNAVVATYEGGVGPLTFDGESWGADLRRQALRTVEISNIFRAIFGNDAMITRVRPILAGQAYGTYQQAWGLNYLLAFVGEATGNHHGSGGTYSSLKAWGNTFASPAPTTPTPGPMPEQGPSYFIYGGGGSGYWNPTDPDGEPAEGLLTLTCPGTNCIWTTNDMSPSTWRTSNQLANATLLPSFGLKRVAYEGGADFPGANATVKRAAANLDRSSPDVDDYNMRDNMLAHHAEWDAEGGDLFVYYQTTGDYRWGFAENTGLSGAQNIFELDSPKLNAISYLAQNSAASTTLGTAIPGSLDGGACSYTNNGLACGGSGSLGLSATGYNKWASYVFRASGSASRNAVVTTTSPSGTVKVWLDGALAGSAAAAATTTISLGTVAAGLHGVIVQLASGSATVVSVAVQ